MKTTFLALSCVSMGCAIDAPDDTAETASAISKDPIDPTPLPPPPPPPPEGSRVVRLSSAELSQGVGLVLAGPLVTVDTTAKSPIRYGTPFTQCEDLNQPGREAAQDECFASFSGSALNQCLTHALEDYPEDLHCYQTARGYHSYIDFNSIAQQYGASDLLFDVAPVYIEGWFDTHRVDINYLRSDTSTPVTGYFGPNRTASLWFPLTSNSPTLIIDDAPNIEMWNMKVLVRLTDISPGVPYSCAAGGIAPACTGGVENIVSARVSHATPRPTFYFSRNVNYLPDWVVDQLIDVDTEIRNAAEGRLQEALTTPTGRAALDKLVTALAIQRVKNTTHPMIHGFTRIVNTWYDNGQLVIEYDWY